MNQIVTVTDHRNVAVAELSLQAEEDGWFMGLLLTDRFPPDLRKALTWHDEVVQQQMLSYLDRALADIDQYELKVSFSDGAIHPIYSLHLTPQNEVSFRITPVPAASEDRLSG